MQRGILSWHKHSSAGCGSPWNLEDSSALVWAPLLSAQTRSKREWFPGGTLGPWGYPPAIWKLEKMVGKRAKYKTTGNCKTNTFTQQIFIFRILWTWHLAMAISILYWIPGVCGGGKKKTNKQKTSEQCPCCIPQTWCPVSSPVSSFFYCYHNTKAVTPKVLLVQRWFWSCLRAQVKDYIYAAQYYNGNTKPLPLVKKELSSM